MRQHSLSKATINVLLLGGIHASAKQAFERDGYSNVELLDRELAGAELLKKVAGAHILGIRSTTHIDAKVLEHAKKLIAIGCFCIGTNQVDLKNAMLAGIPVFNSPYANTRSVAELVIGFLIMLMRGIPTKNAAAHRGQWMKSAKDSFELRGKTLGIVGYGHIGTQVGLIAEALGMRVRFFDIAPKLALGNAKAVDSLKELLGASDVVTLHVPGGKTTENMIAANELKLMKKNAILINAARGTIVDNEALAATLKAKHLAGAAIDVHPQEPASTDERFTSPLQNLPNVILTPHIGGSTLEAQEGIGHEVAGSLISYSNTGSTVGSVNFVEVNLPPHTGKHRVLHIHRNQPGVMAAMNDIFAAQKVNIAGQYLGTNAQIGYVVTDIDQDKGAALLPKLKLIPGTIRTRILY